MSPIETRSGPCNERLERLIALVAVVVAAVYLAEPAAGREHNQEESSTRTEQAATPTEQLDALAADGGYTFVPPPRTISDITTILDDKGHAGSDAAAEARAAASEEPPSGAQGVALARFYWKRGLAAGKIGDVKRQLADLKEAERLSKDADAETRMNILWDLGIAEIFNGNFSDGIRHREEALANVPKKKRGALIVRGASLASIYAASGDLDAADRRLAKAKRLYDKARSWKAWTKWGSTYARGIHWGTGRIQFYKGRYAEAEHEFRLALKASVQELKKNILGKKYAALAHDLIRTNLARSLVRQGQHAEAEIEARVALVSSLDRLGRYSSDTAYMLKRLAHVIGEQGRHVEAEKLARAVVDIYLKIGAPDDSLMLAAAHRQLGEALVAQGRWEDALGEFEAIGQGLATDAETFDRFFAADLSWALALVGAGRSDEAAPVARATLERRHKTMGEEHYDTAEARGVFAKVLAVRGELEAALREFSQAIPILLSGSHHASEDEATTRTARDQRLRIILEAYLELLADIRGSELERKAGIDAAAEAFRVADPARARAVQRALAASAARAAARDPELSELVRQAQDARQQTTAFYGLLATIANQPFKDRQTSLEDQLRQRIAKLKASRAKLDEEIERRFPDYAQLINPKPPTVAETRKQLRAGEALVATYVGERRSFVWALPRKGAVAFAAVPLGRDDIGFDVAYLRGALDAKAATLGAIPDFDVEVAHDLFQALLEPVKDGWLDARSLLIVAHGPLGQLPFALLPTEPAKLPRKEDLLFDGYRAVPWLVRSHAVTVLPSVASLVTLRATPRGDAARRAFAGFGDPWFSTAQRDAGEPVTLASRGDLELRGLPIHLRSLPVMDDVDSAELAQLPRLPDTADELRGIALALGADPTRDVFTGEAASETRVKTMDLSGRKVIVFATHGLVSGDLNGLTQPALALSSPAVVGGEDDGLLTMGEILGLKLDADWVVLSACNTASGAGAGAEAVSGLGRAFFYAGARALLASNTPAPGRCWRRTGRSIRNRPRS